MPVASMLSHLPLAGIVLLVVIGLVVRPLVQLLRYGASGILLFKGGVAQNLRDVLLVVLFTGFIAHAVAGPGAHAPTRLLVPEGSPLHEVLRILGALLIAAGTLLFAAAQLNLGASWRIGIDAHAKPGLVSTGLYIHSRHPIYLGFLTVFAGYAAMLPTVVSLALLMSGYLLLRLQANAEEAHMLRTYGEAYQAYAEQVGRFVPGVGKGARENRDQAERLSD